MKQFNDYDPNEIDLAEKAQKVISKMSKEGRWQMCIPAREDDSDMVISRIISGYRQKTELLLSTNELKWISSAIKVLHQQLLHQRDKDSLDLVGDKIFNVIYKRKNQQGVFMKDATTATVSTTERFGPYRRPTEHTIPKFQKIQEKSLELALLIEDLCPSSPQKSTALTQLELCKMSANASVAIYES